MRRGRAIRMWRFRSGVWLAEKEVRALGQILPDGRHESLGEAPVEGAELQKIMDLARYDGTEMTS